MKDFKKIAFIILITVLLLFVVEKSFAKDFESNQFNLKVKNKDYGIEFREYNRSDRSHIQIEKYVDDWKFAYRYDEDGDKTEHRPRIDYTLISNDYVYIKPRLEYRYYEGDRDDYGRLRSTFGLKFSRAYYEITPMIHFAKDNSSNDLGIDEYQQKLGYVWKLDDKATLDTFIQREDDKGFNKTGLFFGVGLTVGF